MHSGRCDATTSVRCGYGGVATCGTKRCDKVWNDALRQSPELCSAGRSRIAKIADFICATYIFAIAPEFFVLFKRNGERLSGDFRRLQLYDVVFWVYTRIWRSFKRCTGSIWEAIIAGYICGTKVFAFTSEFGVLLQALQRNDLSGTYCGLYYYDISF